MEPSVGLSEVPNNNTNDDDDDDGNKKCKNDDKVFQKKIQLQNKLL